MPFEKIETAQRGAVGVVRLNDPSTLNAISVQMVEELAKAVDQLAAACRALIITGAGRAFCSGANLTAVSPAEAGPAGFDPGAMLDQHVNPLMDKLSGLDIPWISVVNGPAAGVGCSLALAGDLILASDKAYFQQAFTRVGLVPDGGSHWLLTRAVGRVRAMEMILLAEKIPAAQALEWGLISRVVADADLEAAAFALAERLAAGPTQALALTRRLAWRASDEGWRQMLDAERDAQRQAGATRDVQEGVRAFLEKRAPVFEGR